ncbi:MAG: ABC transporter ATP-binding protein [Acidimicrobiales bacterium]|jgi:branched-chain amino acid transport system ATP-binding protein
MLEIDHLSVAYGPVRALTDVSFEAREGSITAVLGANGAGKTTLLRTISGLVPVKEGNIRYAGNEIGGLAPEEVVRLGISHVPEGRGVITELTVEENIRLGALWRRRAPDYQEGIDRAFALFPPLESRRSRSAATLSGGERQMLAIGRALAAKPALLLLDEPSLGLAPLVTAELMRVIRELARTDGLTVVLVEQNARSALSIADVAIVLNLGRVVASDDAATLASADELRHRYLGF